MRRFAWVTPWLYLGVTGADSIAEMSEIVHEYPYVMEELGLKLEASAEDVHKALLEVDIKAIRVPAAIVGREEWDGSHLFPCAIEDRPGRGYVKVLGVHL